MLLTDEWIDALADDVAFCDGKAEAITTIRAVVRLTAQRCAAICREHKGYEMEERAADACAAEIEERIKDKPRPHFNPNEGFGPI